MGGVNPSVNCRTAVASRCTRRHNCNIADVVVDEAILMFVFWFVWSTIPEEPPYPVGRSMMVLI